MKTIEWFDILEEQRQRFDKKVFSITELAHLSRMSRRSLNVQLARLCASGFLKHYAHGLYGRFGTSPAELLAYLDSGAYITGHYALFQHNMVTQCPTRITCFTNRRHGRSRVMKTMTGTFEFVTVSPRMYHHPGAISFAEPEQALCDFIFLAIRRGAMVESVVTFRFPERLLESLSAQLLERYPSTVRAQVDKIRAEA